MYGNLSAIAINHVAPCKRIHEGPGFRIPASVFCILTLALDSGFQPSGICWIPDSGFSYMGRNHEICHEIQNKSIEPVLLFSEECTAKFVLEFWTFLAPHGLQFH